MWARATVRPGGRGTAIPTPRTPTVFPEACTREISWAIAEARGIRPTTRVRRPATIISVTRDVIRMDRRGAVDGREPIRASTRSTRRRIKEDTIGTEAGTEDTEEDTDRDTDRRGIEVTEEDMEEAMARTEVDTEEAMVRTEEGTEEAMVRRGTEDMEVSVMGVAGTTLGTMDFHRPTTTMAATTRDTPRPHQADTVTTEDRDHRTTEVEATTLETTTEDHRTAETTIDRARTTAMAPIVIPIEILATPGRDRIQDISLQDRVTVDRLLLAHEASRDKAFGLRLDLLPQATVTSPS